MLSADELVGKYFCGKNSSDTVIYVLDIIGTALFCINHSMHHHSYSLRCFTVEHFERYYDQEPLEYPDWKEEASVYLAEET
jgi:hypothetical protein